MYANEITITFPTTEAKEAFIEWFHEGGGVEDFLQSKQNDKLSFPITCLSTCEVGETAEGLYDIGEPGYMELE